MVYPEIEPGFLEFETASTTAQSLIIGLRIEYRCFSVNRFLEYGIFDAKGIIKQLQNSEVASTVSTPRLLTHVSLYFTHKTYLCCSYGRQIKWYSPAVLANEDAAWFQRSRMLLTYLITPWCRVLLEKLNGLQLVKKFPAFHGTLKFITALTSVRHLSLSWAIPIQSIYPHPTSWRSILILSTHLRLRLPSGLLPSSFPVLLFIKILFMSTSSFER